MPVETKPPKIAGIYQASKLSYLVKPAIMQHFKALTVQSNTTQILNEAPSLEKVYTYDGKNYGRPQFELLPNDNKKGGVPGQKGFQFTKDDKGVLHLNIIVRAFHPQNNVIPLDFRTIKIEICYKKNNADHILPLEIIQTLEIKKTNELKHVYAHTIIKEEEKEAVYNALVTDNIISTLKITADIWWQKPAVKAPKPQRPPVRQKPKRPVVVKDVCTTFDPAKMMLIKNKILLSPKRGGGILRAMTAKPFMTFKNANDAKKAFNTIRHYKLNRKCTVGNQFTYFLSGNNPPVGKMNGEDAIAFNPSKLQVKYINKRWKIIEGKHSLFDFGINKANAFQALKVIKKHGFDASCFVGRPNAPMTYLKRTKPIRLQMFHRIIEPRMATIMRTVPPAGTQAPKPQKVEITSIKVLDYKKEDASVFQGFFNELESKEYKWRDERKITNSELEHFYYYRLTNDPKKVFFLPQVYRIAVNSENGEPEIYLNLKEEEKENGEKEFRIIMDITLEPYFHPRAKKDLMGDLSNLTNGNIKYVENLVLGGYQSVSFNANQEFLSDNAQFSERITETLTDLNPSGFTIRANHSLESFQTFKDRLLTNDIKLGQIHFDLEEETEDGVIVKKSKPINVELNFNKLKNIPIAVEKAENGNSEDNTIPSRFCLKNKTSAEVTIEDVELTMLSTDGNFIYDADYDLTTEGIEWPLTLAAGEKKEIAINETDIEELSEENMVWNSLVCEPYGMRANIDPEKIMASIIDRATGDSKMWVLNISVPPYARWEDLLDEQKDSFMDLFGILIEIRRKNGEIIGSYELNKTNPIQRIEMSSTVQQMLQNKNHDNREYEYRQKNITIDGLITGDWVSSNDAEHLYIFPPKK